MPDVRDDGFALLSSLQEGQELVMHDDEPVTRLALALYAGGSGDHHPVHVDSDYARAGGMHDVIAHGMFTCARLLRLFTARWPQQALRECRVRFTSPVQVGARLSLRAVVQSTSITSAERRVAFAVTLADATGDIKLRGELVLAGALH